MAVIRAGGLLAFRVFSRGFYAPRAKIAAISACGLLAFRVFSRGRYVPRAKIAVISACGLLAFRVFSLGRYVPRAKMAVIRAGAHNAHFFRHDTTEEWFTSVGGEFTFSAVARRAITAYSVYWSMCPSHPKLGNFNKIKTGGALPILNSAFSA